MNEAQLFKLLDKYFESRGVFSAPKPAQSPLLPNAMFQEGETTFNGYALLSKNQLRAISRGIPQRPSETVLAIANTTGFRVRDGAQTIAQISETGDDDLDQSMIFQYMVDNPHVFGEEWQKSPGNEDPISA